MPEPLDVPFEFKSILQDFTIQFLIDRPADIVNFGATYFNDLRQRRQSIIEKDFGPKGSSSSAHVNDDISFFKSPGASEERKQNDQELRKMRSNEFNEIVKLP
uniref:cAMP-dependent protein kinase type II regulatory subunit n=1 Tax=Lygus hesperus TaxID=30085 RepID=A0A0A9XJ45_LYGHE